MALMEIEVKIDKEVDGIIDFDVKILFYWH